MSVTSTSKKDLKGGQAGGRRARSVSIYLEDDNRAFLDLAAEDRDRSRSYLINAIIREHRRLSLRGGPGGVNDRPAGRGREV